MDLPTISVDIWLLDDRNAAREEALRCANALTNFGAAIIKDSRVTEASNDAFLDLLEDYFAQPPAKLQADIRPEYSYQVGATLELTEKPSCAADVECQSLINALDPSERPLDMHRQHTDPKCRFFWRMQTLEAGQHDHLPNIIPDAFKDVWEARMNDWGSQMKRAVSNVAEMLADGLGLPRDYFTSAATNGAHLLAPTATDLARFGKLNSILAGFHSDINFITIHGRSRYPGLNIWARNTGKRIAVKVAPGHLLVQTGMQLEHLTGGSILAGFHEVVCNEATLQAIERAKRERPERPLIRISSTFFYHLSPQFRLVPVEKLISDADRAHVDTKYPSILVEEQVQNVLKKIALAAQ